MINYNISFNKQYVFNDCKNILVLHFDFYLPDYNCCVEYDGIQHFKPIKRFGGIVSFEENLIRDKIKNEYCKNNNIHLIRISYKENVNDKLNYEFTNFLNSSDLFLFTTSIE